MSCFINIDGTPDGATPYTTVGKLPLTASPAALAYTLDTDTLYAFNNGWQAVAGGGGGAVDSVNGETGVVVLTKSSFGLGSVDNTSDASKPVSTATQTALDAKQGAFTGPFNGIAGYDGAGAIGSVSGLQYDVNSGGISQSVTALVLNNAPLNLNQASLSLDPQENSPNTAWNTLYSRVEYDPDNTGFTIGTAGRAATIASNEFVHQGTSNIGESVFTQNSFNIGNGTDAITAKGVSYAYGFGQFNALVTVNGPLQGYGFQPTVHASAAMTSNAYVNAFYDNANIDTTINSGYTSFSASPNLDLFGGNNGYTGLNLAGNLGTFGTGGYTGVNVSPNVTSAAYATGLNINMSGVTVFAGTQATLTRQDLTFTFVQRSSNDNSVTLRYTAGGTAGSEVVSIAGTDISVQIASGVSTATQIKAALDADLNFVAAITTTISGVASNAQVTFGPSNFAGGANPGNKKAAQFGGDVDVTGALSFSGALSIGKLNAFAQQALADGGGTPGTIHGLISAPFIAANATVANADMIGVNTAMILTVGANATVTTSFIGLTALGLPAVIEVNSGATVDHVAGAAFALSLSSTATAGGTVDRVMLCQALAIPNGLTTVNNMYGYYMDTPFGGIATNEWGVYIKPVTENYMAGSLVLGPTDTVANSSVAIEVNATDKAVLLSRLTTAQESALTSVDGMLIYNTTTGKFRGRAAGSWVDLH